jgi:hypothetical protein
MYKSYISKTLALVLTIMIGLAVLVPAQPADDVAPKKANASLASTDVPSGDKGQPIMLLLIGLAVFVGATIKRKRSTGV